MTLRRRIGSALLAVGVVLILGTSFVDLRVLRPILYEEMHQHASIVLRAVSSAADHVSRPNDLRRVVTAMGGESNVALIVVVDVEAARVVASSQAVLEDEPLTALPPALAALVRATAETHESQTRSDGTSLAVTEPVEIRRSADRGQASPGVTLVLFEERSLRRALASLMTSTIGTKALVVLIVSGTALLLLSRYVLTPLRSIGGTMDLVGAGALNVRVPVTSDDEIGLLARHLNTAVHARATSEQALTEALERVDVAVRGGRVGLWDYPLGSDRVYVSPLFLGLFGLGADGDTISVKALRETAHPDDLLRYDELLRRHVRSGEPFEISIRHRHADGSSRWIRQWGHVVRNAEGRPIRIAGAAIDETERRTLEAELVQAKEFAEQAAHVKANFLATMSHEIRTPMNGVIGLADLLVEAASTPEQREYAEAIRRSGDSLLAIINDILDISKIEAGRLQLEHVAFGVDAIVHDVTDMLDQRAADRQVRLLTIIEPDVPGALTGDGGRIRQVLTNLVGNAVKFTEHGEVIVRVSRTGAADTYMFEVLDTGIGIPSDVVPHLFEAFMQADSSTTRKYGGTGLGLAICKRLVEQMGGTIAVESVVQRGSRFWFTLPLPPAADASLPALAGLRMAVVSDHAATREAMSSALTRLGARVVSAAPEDLPAAPAETDAVVVDGASGRALGCVAGWRPPRPAVMKLTPLAVRAEDAGPPAGVDVRVRGLRGVQVVEALVACGLRTPSVAAPPVNATPGAFEARGASILVAEDNATNQRVVQRLLEGFGCRLTIVGNGLEAVRVVQEQPFDLVLMDCQMPVMDGFEASSAIRALETLRPQPPIIAVTANALEGDRERCLEAGMSDYLAKPIRREPLRAMLERWLGPERTDTPTEQRARAVGA